MTLDSIKRRAQQAVALYEQRILACCDRREIATAYRVAVDAVDQYGLELDYEQEHELNQPTDYTDYFNLVARLDLTIEQYNSYFKD